MIVKQVDNQLLFKVKCNFLHRKIWCWFIWN